jgi:hypothetical protein
MLETQINAALSPGSDEICNMPFLQVATENGHSYLDLDATGKSTFPIRVIRAFVLSILPSTTLFPRPVR